MALSKTTINELAEILKQEFGCNLNFEEASDASKSLIGFYSSLLTLDIKNKQQSQYADQ